jgi:mono/diheme cytochrome c family protein
MARTEISILIGHCRGFGWTLIAGGLLLLGCDSESVKLHEERVDARRGLIALRYYGCGACHRIPGVVGADGVVGPPLVNMGQRVYIAGEIPNTPQNMVRWILAPHQLAPGSAMPNMQVTPADARSITAYLFRPA